MDGMAQTESADKPRDFKRAIRTPRFSRTVMHVTVLRLVLCSGDFLKSQLHSTAPPSRTANWKWQASIRKSL